MEAPDVKPQTPPVEIAPEHEAALLVPPAPIEVPDLPVEAPLPLPLPVEPFAPVEPIELLEPPIQTAASAIPGLEYMEEKVPEPVRPVPVQEAPITKSEPLTLDLLEPLEPIEMSSGSFVGIQKGSGGRVELTPRVEASPEVSGSFERFDAPPEIAPATPETPPATSEESLDNGAEAAVPEQASAPPEGPVKTTEAAGPEQASAPDDEPTVGEFLKMFPDARPD